MRIRLILSFILVVLITIFSMVFIAARRTATEVRNFVERGGVFGAESIINDLEAFYRVHHTWNGVDSLFHPGQNQGKGPGPGPGGPRFRVADRDGYFIFDTQNPAPSGKLTTEERSSAIPLRVNDQTVGFFLPGTGIPIPPEVGSDLLGRLNNAAYSAALIAGGIAVVFALVLGFQILRPVRELTQAAQTLGQGELSYRVPVRGDDELSSLARTFNHMAASLEQAEERRKALTADIAHELRTPLAVQHANLEALQDGIYPLAAENLEPVLEQTLLLERLVDDLRTLALADSGQLELVRTRTDYPRLIRRVADRYQAGMGSRQLDVSLPPDAACPPLDLDPGRVEQILGNLLSNALQHTPEGGTVTLALQCNSGQAKLTVQDSGPGIPEEALPHIFERFYRGDRSRSRAEGGTGLGLSIARKLAEAMGGSLQASNHPEGGAVFTLSFPG